MTGRELAALSGQGSIIVIRRPFVDWLGNIGRALLLDQLLYESDANGGDWFAVTDAEWADRLLLSRREIRDARDFLSGMGILEVESRGMPRRTWYKVGSERAAGLFSAFLETGGVSTQERPNVRTRVAKWPHKSGQMATHSIQGGSEGVEGTSISAPKTTGAPDGANARRRGGRSADDSDPHTPAAQARPARKPKAARQPDPLAFVARTIMLDLTGRDELPGKREAALVWPIVHDMRPVCGDVLDGGLELWNCFREALEARRGWDTVKVYNAREAYGRWAANGGASTVEAVRRWCEAERARRAGGGEAP